MKATELRDPAPCFDCSLESPFRIGYVSEKAECVQQVRLT
jgi:hypothetical protein